LQDSKFYEYLTLKPNKYHLLNHGSCDFCRSKDDEFITFFIKYILVGGFNPFEQYLSKWKSSPCRGENNNYLKPPPIYISRNPGSLSENGNGT